MICWTFAITYPWEDLGCTGFSYLTIRKPVTFESIEKQPHRRFDTLQPKAEPDFIFDPDSLGLCFVPFERVPPGPSFRHLPGRVIAPIPSKADGLRGAFIRRIHKRAMEIVQSSQTIVSIGYSFNPYDRASYSPLLQAARGARILLVVPEAQDLASRLTGEYPGIEWHAVPATFREWVLRGYDGLQSFEASSNSLP